MEEYLFIFGYESPETLRTNEEFGDDFEESGAVFIRASSEEDALRWGRVIAEEFLKRVFDDRSVSWTERAYASFIESDRDTIARAREFGVEQVTVGEEPRYEDLGPRGTRGDSTFRRLAAFVCRIWRKSPQRER